MGSFTLLKSTSGEEVEEEEEEDDEDDAISLGSSGTGDPDPKEAARLVESTALEASRSRFSHQ